jgi:EAL domain-containing protein (putative c-di-GMP-specific phosphodiesterase class I)
MTQREEIEKQSHHLKQRGVRLVLDDFGAGY